MASLNVQGTWYLFSSFLKHCNFISLLLQGPMWSSVEPRVRAAASWAWAWRMSLGQTAAVLSSSPRHVTLCVPTSRPVTCPPRNPTQSFSKAGRKPPRCRLLIVWTQICFKDKKIQCCLRISGSREAREPSEGGRGKKCLVAPRTLAAQAKLTQSSTG